MISLTRLNGENIILNAELIETVEARPDTLITLITGNRVMVKEKVSDIIEKVNIYRRNINLIMLEKLSKLYEKKDS